MQQLEEIFRYYKELSEKYGMRSLNMGEAADECINARATSSFGLDAEI